MVCIDIHYYPLLPLNKMKKNIIKRKINLITSIKNPRLTINKNKYFLQTYFKLTKLNFY